MSKIVRRTITVTIIERWTLLWLDHARLTPGLAVVDPLPMPSSGLLCTATSVTSTASVTHLVPTGDKVGT